MLLAEQAQHPYQRDGSNFLFNTVRGILGDDMGLGKSLQALVAAKRAGGEKVLITCPKTVKVVWKLEIEKWYPGTKVTIIEGNSMRRAKQLRDATGIVIVNYEQFRMHYLLLQQLQWDGFIFDEAHKLKNRKSITRGRVSSVLIKHKQAFVYFLTATPVVNKPHEIWSVLNLIDPKQYKSFWQFAGRYVEQKTEYYNGIPVRKLLGPKNTEELKERISEVFLRRLRDDVLDLPPLVEIPVQVELSGEQKRIYDEMRKKMLAILNDAGDFVLATVVVAQMTRLKQIALSHGLVSDPQHCNGAKLEALTDRLEGCEEKSVIFSQFADFIHLAAKQKEWKDISGVISGDTDFRERLRLVEKFQDPDSDLRNLFISIKAGGEGITLTQGSVIHAMDKFWAPSVNEQAYGRLHRQGQERRVLLYSYVATNTIDEYINQLLDEKSAMISAIIPVETLRQVLR